MKDVIFDLDNTLISSDCLDPFIIKMKQFPINSKERNDARKEFIAHFKDCYLYPEVDHVLQFIKNNNVKASIVTNSVKYRMTALVKLFNIPIPSERLFHKHSFDRFGHIRKPLPQPLLAAIQSMKSDPSNTIMVGNEPIDIQAAKNANIDSVACHWGASDNDWNAMLALNPTYIAEQPSDLITIITTRVAE